VASAAWLAADTMRGGRITAGDLRMTAGRPTWKQVTPGVTTPRSGDLDATPVDFWSMPGDVIRIDQPVTTTLVGENLAGGFSVDFANDSAVADDVTAGKIAVSFHVEDADGRTVAPDAGDASFGTLVRVPGLTGTDEGTPSTWHVVTDVRVLGDYAWTADSVTADPERWSSGDLRVELEQVRDGEGFTAAPGRPDEGTR
jgi:alternate signal-mediated exported protein